MRMNNLSARLISNAWLLQNGYDALAESLTYEEFATELRRMTVKTCIQQPFSNRPDACAYIRKFACMKRSEVSK